MKVLISILIPIFNEEDNIFLLHARLQTVLSNMGESYEMIFINDKSDDQSLLCIKQLAASHPEVKYIDFSRNFGHQNALTAGLDYCVGDHVVIIDGDLQDPPELIPELYQKALEGYEVVYAKRKSRKDKNLIKKFCYLSFYRLLSKLSNIHIPLDTGDFRLINRKVVEALKMMDEHHKFLRGQIAWLGFNQVAVEYDRDLRQGGASGYNYKKLFSLALDGITSFSNIPLRLASISGFIVFFISIFLMCYTLYSYFFNSFTPQGWASLMVSILFIGSIQLLSIGIVGEYVVRIISEVRKRPHYIIRETNIRIEKKKGE